VNLTMQKLDLDLGFIGSDHDHTTGSDMLSEYILFLLLSDCYFSYNYIAIVAFFLLDKILLALTLIADGTEEMELSESLPSQFKQYDTLVRAGVSCTSAYVPVIFSISSDSVHSAKGSTDTGIKIVPDIASLLEDCGSVSSSGP
jgi:hypothetical protein